MVDRLSELPAKTTNPVSEVKEGAGMRELLTEIKYVLYGLNYKDLVNRIDKILSESQPGAQPQQVEKPKVVCFCGSTRFAEYFMINRWELEKQGIITFGINILPDNYFVEGNSHGAEQEGVKEILDELHKRKIDLSDEVHILNVGGYIGESTRAEIEYAQSIGKPVKYFDAHTPSTHHR